MGCSISLAPPGDLAPSGVCPCPGSLAGLNWVLFGAGGGGVAGAELLSLQRNWRERLFSSKPYTRASLPQIGIVSLSPRGLHGSTS